MSHKNADKGIVPSNITKPMQFLAALLVGLFTVNVSFLAAANIIKSPEWIPALLVIASVSNVPLFIFTLFLLITVFRPQMQDDTYYSKYLLSKWESEKLSPIKITSSIEQSIRKVIPNLQPQQEQILQLLKEAEIDRLTEQFKGNRTLSEIFNNTNQWPDLVNQFEKDISFRFDLEKLVKYDLVSFTKNDIRKPELTDIGKRIAEKALEKGELFHQKYGRINKSK